MPDQITHRGTNSQGNAYDTRISDTGAAGYHYSNTNGSYYYANTDGSTYYNSGNGYPQYTAPSGEGWRSYEASPAGKK